MPHNILVIGGSRHIGYYTSLRFLDAGANVTFLMRSPQAFDSDESIQKYMKSGSVNLVRGDGLVAKDVQRAWIEATKEAAVDLVLFTVGFTGNPKFQFTKGFVIHPNNLVTQCLLNVLCEMPKTSSLPKIVTLSASGVSRSSRAKVPFALRPVYGYLIQNPLQDKLGMERIIYHCSGWDWNTEDGEPGEDIMGKDWKHREGLPSPGTLQNAMIVRGAMFNDGECRADSPENRQPYRAGEGEVGGYFISRKDVAHFIFEAVTKNWEKYGNKQVSIAY
ncbi:Reductase pytE [Psilocybe cubensis]|uniref:Reductase pytE n=2 Tax=Psilocybe cubensis TaxID=181762 RepID=A0ACB8GQR6_PSICU|nr:Reductase pytE [Psilocybe cubensis]KAH9477379.1 Reductase pytE [Psilocybe cubensis]